MQYPVKWHRDRPIDIKQNERHTDMKFTNWEHNYTVIPSTRDKARDDNTIFTWLMKKRPSWSNSFHDTYVRAYAPAGARITSPRSFLKRTCSHAIPYKKVDAARRNVPLETRYMYVAQIHTTRAHTYTYPYPYPCTYTCMRIERAGACAR